MTTITCRICGKETYKVQSTQKYGSYNCLNAARRKRNGQNERYKGPSKNVYYGSSGSPVSDALMSKQG